MTEARYCLDTNICIYLLRGASDKLRDRVSACPAGSIVISAIVQAEVAFGLVKLGQEEFADRLFSKFTVLPFDEKAALVYARIPFRRGGFDRLIAAHALALDLTLVTNNARDFADIAGLRCENWTD